MYKENFLRRRSAKKCAAAVSIALSLSALLLCAPIAAAADDGATQGIVAPAPIAAAQSVSVVLDGLAVVSDAAPYIDGNGRTMVPESLIGGSLGAQTDWDAAAQTVTIQTDSKTIALRIGSPTLTVDENGAETSVAMDTAAVVSSDHIFVPLRFIAEALGLGINWDGVTQTVFLTTPAADAPAITVTNEDVTIDAGVGYPLGGTLSIPDGAPGPYPCVVLVSGSGPNDRDETINTNKPFKDIADYLASKGIAVLRYDKRSYTHGAKMMQEFGGGVSVEQEYIQDAAAASDLMKADPRIDPKRVYILGHSEGGMLAPRIDAEGGDFAGIIIMAGSPRNLEDIRYDQLMAEVQLAYAGTDNYDLAMSQMAQVRQIYDSIKSMTDDQAKSTNVNDLLGPALGDGVWAYYYKEMADHPAAGYIADTAKPFLIMQGMSDIQIYPSVDFKAYQDLFAGRSNATLKTYNGLTHLFMPATDNDVVGNPNMYTAPEHVDPQVLADIASWVSAN